jgi:hypothetical protein
MLRDERAHKSGAMKQERQLLSGVTRHRRGRVAAVPPGLLGLVALLAACSGPSPGANQAARSTTSAAGSGRPVTSATAAPEAVTPGDIPDTTAYVMYANAAGRYSFVHPEGWAQTGQGTAIAFTDKYNRASADVTSGASAPNPASANATDVPALRGMQPAFELVSVLPVTILAGSGVRITYRTNSAPDPVTGRSARIEVQRYEIFGGGHVVVLELSGAVGADNVDPYNRMVQSLRTS